eukprot:gene27443-33146_t
MNKLCYKTIFSKRLGALVAVGEHAASQGKANGLFSGAGLDKGCSRAAVCYIGALTLSFALVSMAWAAPANTALPTGGQVAQGAAAISQSGANMAIHQSTARAVVNWQNFDIGKDAKVNIVQPNAQAVLLNRVTGAAPSQIFGQMTANGQVVLVNPNGVTFGKDGSVSAAGLTASTLNTTDADFMAGRKHYTRDGATGQVLNQGTLTSAPGGYVALLGASVSNEGKIVAPQGKVALGAAETITMPLYGSSRIKLELTPSAINAAVANQKGGSIVTEGGQVYMQAAAVGSAMASVMQSGGIDTTGAQGGAVYLLADGGRIQVDGSITANSTSAGHKGGDIILGRDEVTGVLAKSTDVSGARLESKGGFVETSGEFLKVDGIQVKAKEWLLDPNDIVIGSTATTGGSLSAAQAANGVSQILASDVSNALIAGTNVIIATSALAPGGNGDITVDTAVSNTADGNTLTLNAGRNVVLNNSITASNISLNAATGSVSGAGALTTTGLLTLNSATDGTLSGNISGAGGLTKTGAGTMTLTGANTFTGATTVTEGELVNTKMGDLKTSSIVIAGGATFEANVTTDTRYNGTTTVSGAGTFKKTGAAGLTLSTGNLSLRFASNAGGLIAIQAGSLQNDYLKTALSNNLADIHIAKDALLDMRGEAVQMRGLSGAGNVINSYAGSNLLTMGVGDVASNSYTYSGVMGANWGSPNATPSLTVNLVKAGAGTQILTGTNLYTGTTTISGGTLQVGDGNGTGTLGSGKVTLANGANLNYKRNVSTTIANAIEGSGNVNADITAGGLIVDRGINLSTGNITLVGSNTATDGAGVKINGVALQATNIELKGNSRNHFGIDVGANVIATSGAVVIEGTSVLLQGVMVNAGRTIQATGSAPGKVTMTGKVTAPAGTGSGIHNLGTISGGSVEMTGTSAGTGAGISMGGMGSIEASSAAPGTGTGTVKSGDIKLEGTSAGGLGVNVNTSTAVAFPIRASNDVTIQGKSSATAVQQHGVFLFPPSTTVQGKNVTLIGESVNGNAVQAYSAISATGGDVNITGTSTGSPATASALSLQGVITADQNVVIKGENTDVANNAAVGYINKTVKATNGQVDITTSTQGTTSVALQLASGANLTAKNQVNIKADTLHIDSTSTPATINAGSGTVSIHTVSADAKINIGGADAGSATLKDRILGLSTAELNLITAGNLVIGDASNSGGITVSAATATNATTGNVTLQTGGNIEVNAALTLGTQKLSLQAGGNVTQVPGAAIKAAELQLKGLTATANFTLGEKTNAVGKLAAAASKVVFANASALEIGEVNLLGLTSGITATAGASITTQTGNLTITKDISNIGSGDVVLGAGVEKLVGDGTGGDVKTTTGIRASNSGSGKTYIYTGSVAGTGKLSDLHASLSTLNLSDVGLNLQNTDSNAAYPTIPTTSNLGITGATAATQVMFREKVAMAFTSGAHVNHTYGDAKTKDNGSSKSALWTEVKAALGTANSTVTKTTAAGNTLQITGAALASDLSEATLNTPNYNGSGYLNYTASGYTYGALSGAKYATTLASGQVAQVVMSKANLTKVTASKTYDGLQTVKAVEVTAIEGVNGESFTAASGTAAISGKNVAGAKTVTDLTGLSLTSGNGGDTGNYNLNSGLPAQGAATNNVDIGKATLALSLADQTKVYDGKLDAAIKAGDITATGVIVGGNTEKVSLKAVTGAYNNKNVANANSASATVSASDVNTGTAANGLDLGNYTLSDTSATQTVTNSNSNITKATLALGLADQTKVYDGKLDAAIKAANGLDLGNYTLSDTSATQTVTNSKSNITKATLALSLADQTKVYDGTLDAAIAAAQVSAKGVTVNGQTESASFNAVSGSYNSKNVADAQTVSTTVRASDVDSIANNLDLNNYTLSNTNAAQVVTGKGAISKATLTLALADQTKVYDGTVDAVIAAGQIRASGVNVSGQTESALFKALSGSYDSKNVVGAAAVRATVRASDVASTANNLDLNNYTLSNTNATQVATGIGKITQANLTLTANSDSSKVYNEQSVSGFAITSGSLKGTDTAALDLAAITAGGKRTDAGTTATTVNDSDYKNGNYAISKVDGTFFIAQKEVALAAAKTYDGNKTLTGTQLRITTGVGAETLGYNSASINNKDVKDNNTNYVDAVVLTDGTGKASNYKFTAARSANNTVALTQANLTLTANSDSSKLYNGAEQSVSGYAITSGSLKGTDTAALDLAAITAGGKRTDAGTTATTVNDSDYTNGNYAISKVDGVLYVAQKEVALAAAKTYDGGKTLTGTQLRITTGVGAETLGYNSASINNKDVKDNNTNYVDAVVLTDGTGKASNYKFTAARSANNTVALTQAHLKVTLADQTKTYDGTTAATLVPSAFTVKGVTVAGQTETASVNQTVALYNDKNVLGASSVTADLAAGNFAAATGTDLNNYNLPTSVIGKGKITPKEAAVTGTATTVQANGTQQIQAPATKSGFVSGEEVTVSGLATGLIAGAYNSNLSAAAANAATVLSNYKIAYTNAALRITPAIVTNSTVVMDLAFAHTSMPTSRLNLSDFFNAGGVGAAMSRGVDSGAGSKAPTGAPALSSQACSPENLQQCECKESGDDGIELCLAPDGKL